MNYTPTCDECEASNVTPQRPDEKDPQPKAKRRVWPTSERARKSEGVYVVHGELGNYLWVSAEDHQERPFTVFADKYEDVPQYDPAQVPQVGEDWAYYYGNDPGSVTWRCIAVDEEQGVWQFVDIGEMTSHPRPREGLKECSNQAVVFTRRLPEDDMKKVR
jgi:hypothetical protein